MVIAQLDEQLLPILVRIPAKHLNSVNCKIIRGPTKEKVKDRDIKSIC